MSLTRIALCAGLIGLLLCASGCVELIGQRIVIWHDAQRDTLHVLLFYDGVHDSGEDRHGVAREQIPQLARSGSVLLLDWPLHIDMDEARKAVADPDTQPEDRELAAFVLANVTAHAIGHYRDGHGHIGGMQHVQIERASEFLRQVNAAISRLLLEEFAADDPADPAARTQALVREAAQNGHEWVTLDGHALRIEFPVHPFEWRQVKASALQQLAEAYTSDTSWIVQAISAFSGAYDDTGGRVRILIGDPDEATTLRFRLREEYEPSLEQVVIENAPLQLPGLWRIGRAQHPDAMWLYQEISPPEQRVIDTLSRIGHAEGYTAEEALRLIEQYIERVSDRVYPVPPAQDDIDETIEAWRAWARRMMAYPIAD
jgi:hypothetical protein